MDELRKYRNQTSGPSSARTGASYSSAAPSSGRSYGGGGSSYSSSSTTAAAPSSYSRSGTAGRSAFADDDAGSDDDDVEGIKTQIRGVKQDTLNSTRSALSALNDTEEVGARTLNKLAQQSEQLGTVDRQLDLAGMHADRASDRTDELSRLNKSIFRPTFRNPFSSSKAKKREQELLQAQNEFREHSEHRTQQATEMSQSRQRVDNALRQDVSGASSRGKYGSERSKYLFEDEDPAVDDEIDSNLDSMSEGLARLKGIGMAMGQEVNAQNERLDRISGKTDRVGEKIAVGTKRLEKFK